MAEELPGGCRGGDQPPGDDLGRRTAATGSLLPQEGGSSRMPPHCRRRKVRSAPFPPAAKTAPAPLRLLSPPRGARRGPLSVLPKEKRAVHGPKRKAPGCALVQWPSALTEVDVSVQAPIWACLRARYHLLRGRDCCPVADGADSVGVQGCIRPASLSARSASLRATLAVAEAPDLP